MPDTSAIQLADLARPVSSRPLHALETLCDAQGEAPLAVLQWAAWQPGQRPQGLQIAEFFAANVASEAAPPGSGPYLSAARVGAWRALVAAHRKANDEHVKLYGAREPGRRAHAGTFQCMLMPWRGSRSGSS